MEYNIKNKILNELFKSSMHPVQRAVFELADATVDLSRSKNLIDIDYNSRKVEIARQLVNDENSKYLISPQEIENWYVLCLLAIGNIKK